MLSDEDFSQELVHRLNKLLNESNDEVRDCLSRLIEQRVALDRQTAEEHPTLVSVEINGTKAVSFLGVLNGILNTDTRITAVCNKNNDQLLYFK